MSNDISEINSQQNTLENSYPITMDTFMQYVGSKFIPSLITGGTIGGIKGYILGENVSSAILIYGYSFGSSIVAFYCTSYLVRGFRNKDDYINHGIAGSVIGSFNAAYYRGLRSFPGAFISGMIQFILIIFLIDNCYQIVGGILGSAYYYSGNYLYERSKMFWIHTRRNALLYSDETRFFNKDIRVADNYLDDNKIFTRYKTSEQISRAVGRNINRKGENEDFIHTIFSDTGSSNKPQSEKGD